MRPREGLYLCNPSPSQKASRDDILVFLPKTKPRLMAERANVCLEGLQSTQRLAFLSLTLRALCYPGK